MCRAILKPARKERRERRHIREIFPPILASFVTVASTNERKRSSPALERNVGSLPRVWSCPSRSIFWAGPVVAGIAAFPGTRQQVENRRNAQLTPEDSLVCAFLLVEAVFVEARIVFVDVAGVSNRI